MPKDQWASQNRKRKAAKSVRTSNADRDRLEIEADRLIQEELQRLKRKREAAQCAAVKPVERKGGGNQELVTITNEFIDSAKSDAGAWSRKQVEILGLKWPLRAGWKLKIIGKP